MRINPEFENKLSCPVLPGIFFDETNQVLVHPIEKQNRNDYLSNTRRSG